MEPPELSTPSLEAWIRRTRTPLDLLALFTIWLTILPLTGSTDTRGLTPWTVGRFALSLIYGIDLARRARLSGAPARYMRAHPLSILAVVVPATRVAFSLRLLHAMFRMGNLVYFLFVTTVLVLNGVVLVYFFEVDAPGANIVTMGDALWWSMVTLFTVGYGDYYPVSVGGQVTAVVLMALGLVTAAVITAQIASNFLDQADARRAAKDGAPRGEAGAGSPGAPGPSAGRDEVEGVPGLHARLERIEQLLRADAGDD